MGFSSLIDDFYLITDFDCWDYDDERSLFVGIVKTIFNKLHLGDLNHSVLKDIEIFANSILTDVPVHFNFDSFLSFSENSNKIFNLINEHLKVSNKNLIFILDNLDRMSNSNIVFVYKTIATKLKFCNTTFICMYDESLVNKALNAYGFLPEYLDKILNYKISIPDVNNKYLNQLANRCINNFIDKYFDSDSDSKYLIDKQQIYTSIKFITNPRDLIRFFNFLVTKVSKTKELNLADLITLTVIKTIDFDLYNLIFNCKDILISRKNYDDGKTNPTSITKNNLISLFDSSQEKNYSVYTSLFVYLFPSFMRNELRIITTEKELSKRPIESSCFFDLYFIENSNDFIAQDKMIKSKIKYFMKTSFGDIGQIFSNQIDYLTRGTIAETFGDYIVYNSLGKNTIEKIVKYTSSEENITIRNACYDATSTLIDKLTKLETNKIKKKWSNDPKYFLFCAQCYIKTQNPFFYSVSESLKKIILDSGVNLFSKTYYYPDRLKTIFNQLNSYENNIYFTKLTKIMKNNENLLFIKELIKYIQQNNNIGRAIFSYIERETLDNIISKYKPNNKENEKYLLDIRQLIAY